MCESAICVVTGKGSPINTVETCGTSKTITVTCLVRSATQQVLDIALENADGQVTAVCDVPDLPGTTSLVYSLAPGDSIYGVQACYRDGMVVGVTFSAASGPLTCGNPQDEDAVCRSTTVKQPAPLAAIYGQCDGQGLVEITRVCFNPFWTNPTIPVTGEQQQGLEAAVGSRLGDTFLKQPTLWQKCSWSIGLDRRCWQGQQQQTPHCAMMETAIGLLC